MALYDACIQEFEKKFRRQDEALYHRLKERGKHTFFTIERQTWYISVRVAGDENEDVIKRRLYERLRRLRDEFEFYDDEVNFDFLQKDNVNTVLYVEEGSALCRVEVSGIADNSRLKIDQLLDYVSESDDDVILNISARYVHFGRATQGSHWGGGGPGGWPFIPYWTIPDHIFNEPGAYHTFTLPEPAFADAEPDYVSNLLSAGGDGVIVALLDTAPSPTFWEQRSDDLAQNPLIASLRNAYDHDNFRIFYTMDDEQEAFLEGAEIPSYALNDHGIFVAGIVHSIAPKAKIWLFRVITDSGVTYENPVQDAMLKLKKELGDQNQTTHVLINCSLNLVDRLAEFLRDWKSNNERFFYRTGEQIETITTKPVVVVGASGNEASFKSIMQANTEPTLHSDLLSKNVPDAPPYPRFPAAFESTLGVSALNRQELRTVYANWADDFDLPDERENTEDSAAVTVPRRGIAVYGGDIIQVPDPDPTKAGNPLYNLRLSNPIDSILGAYISDFQIPIPESAYDNPSGPPPPQFIKNDQGWALWSGTSFAAPIITAVLALIASHEPTLTQAQLVERLIAYCGTPRLQHTDNTGNPVLAEHMLKVKQKGIQLP